MNELTEFSIRPLRGLSLKIHAVNKFLSPADDELAERLPRLYC